MSSRSPPTSGIASNNGHAEKNTATQNGHAASGEVENHLGGVIGRSTEPPKASTFRRRSIWRKVSMYCELEADVMDALMLEYPRQWQIIRSQ